MRWADLAYISLNQEIVSREVVCSLSILIHMARLSDSTCDLYPFEMRVTTLSYSNDMGLSLTFSDSVLAHSKSRLNLSPLTGMVGGYEG